MLLATTCSIILQPTHSTLQTYVPWRIKKSIHKQNAYNPMENEGLKQNEKGKKDFKSKELAIKGFKTLQNIKIPMHTHLHVKI